MSLRTSGTILLLAGVVTSGRAQMPNEAHGANIKLQEHADGSIHLFAPKGSRKLAHMTTDDDTFVVHGDTHIEGALTVEGDFEFLSAAVKLSYNAQADEKQFLQVDNNGVVSLAQLVNKGSGKIAATDSTRDYGDIDGTPYFASEKQLSTVDAKLDNYLTTQKNGVQSDLGTDLLSVQTQIATDASTNAGARATNANTDMLAQSQLSTNLDSNVANWKQDQTNKDNSQSNDDDSTNVVKKNAAADARTGISETASTARYQQSKTDSIARENDSSTVLSIRNKFVTDAATARTTASETASNAREKGSEGRSNARATLSKAQHDARVSLSDTASSQRSAAIRFASSQRSTGLKRASADRDTKRDEASNARSGLSSAADKYRDGLSIILSQDGKQLEDLLNGKGTAMNNIHKISNIISNEDADVADALSTIILQDSIALDIRDAELDLQTIATSNAVEQTVANRQTAIATSKSGELTDASTDGDTAWNNASQYVRNHMDNEYDMWKGEDGVDEFSTTAHYDREGHSTGNENFMVAQTSHDTTQRSNDLTAASHSRDSDSATNDNLRTNPLASDASSDRDTKRTEANTARGTLETDLQDADGVWSGAEAGDLQGLSETMSNARAADLSTAVKARVTFSDSLEATRDSLSNTMSTEHSNLVAAVGKELFDADSTLIKYYAKISTDAAADRNTKSTDAADDRIAIEGAEQVDSIAKSNDAKTNGAGHGWDDRSTAAENEFSRLSNVIEADKVKYNGFMLPTAFATLTELSNALATGDAGAEEVLSNSLSTKEKQLDVLSTADAQELETTHLANFAQMGDMIRILANTIGVDFGTLSTAATKHDDATGRAFTHLAVDGSFITNDI